MHQALGLREISRRTFGQAVTGVPRRPSLPRLASNIEVLQEVASGALDGLCEHSAGRHTRTLPSNVHIAPSGQWTICYGLISHLLRREGRVESGHAVR